MNTKKMAPSPGRKPDRKRLERRRTTVAATVIRISQVGTVFIPFEHVMR
jgi:hypothetical protein